MSETNFWKEIKNNVGHLGHWSRIESHATSDGFPDTVLTIDGFETKIELKYCNEKKPFEIRPSQIRWFRKNVRNGGEPWVFIKAEMKIRTFYILARGRVIDYLEDKPLKTWLNPQLNKIWYDKMDWDEFLKCICSSEGHIL